MKMNDNNILPETTIADLGNMPAFAGAGDLFFTNPDDDKKNSRLCDYGIKKCRLFEALSFTERAIQKGNFILPLYTEEEIRKNFMLSKVCLLNFIRHPGAPVCIICPGGGYNREWILVEGYPMAQALDESGINSVVLIYRTGYFNLFPHPLDDLSRAVSWLLKNQDLFSINMNNYFVMGASAGGHLAAMWGTCTSGSRYYGLPSPSALILMYPAANITCFYERWKTLKNEKKEAEAEAESLFLKRIGGEDFTRQDIEKYSLDCTIDPEFPPTYLVHAKDDPVVPVNNSLLTESLLIKQNIPHKAHFATSAGHSFGMGIGTDAEGWIEEAIDFYNHLYSLAG